MRLQDLFDQAGVQPDSLGGVDALDPEDTEFARLIEDSRVVEPGDAFVEVPGGRVESWHYIGEARKRGAVAVMASSPAGLDEAGRQGLPAALFGGGPERFREVSWKLARAAYRDPSAHFAVLGVTGTNGKTTTAHLLRDALTALGGRAAYLGTLGLELPERKVELTNTTPLSFELNRHLAAVRDAGVSALAMEVSSHALAEHRADGVSFDVAIFTNLTQDHLDFHGTMEAYAAAKYRLFAELPVLGQRGFIGCLNVDDPVGQQWYETLPAELLTYGLHSGMLRAEVHEVRFDRIALTLSGFGETAEVHAPLGGRFNVENLLAAGCGLVALGKPLAEVGTALSQARPVDGRFEPVPNEAGIGILVDYAHTPDALAKLLDAARELTTGRLIVVFGCGGDRDRDKRPKMARVASSRADLTILTSDNPRHEDPRTILSEVEVGLVPGKESQTIIERPAAVARAIQLARPGDLVVLAGKGHETYQILGDTRHPMDDRELARQALEARS